MLEGYKTYILGALMIVTGVLMGLNYVTPEIGQIILTFLVGGGFITTRNAIAKKSK